MKVSKLITASETTPAKKTIVVCLTDSKGDVTGKYKPRSPQGQRKFFSKWGGTADLKWGRGPEETLS